MERITLRHLAARLGITEAAVSMALRNHPRISTEVRRRARQLAEDLGYVRNPALSRQGALARRGRAGGMPLALILQQHPVHGPGLSSYNQRLEEAARRLGYQLQIHLMKHEDTPVALARILQARGVEAVVVGPIFHAGFVAAFPWERFSAVAAGPGYYRPACHLVLPDRLMGAKVVFENCLQRGYRRLGWVEYREPVEPVDHDVRCAARRLCQARAWECGATLEILLCDPYDPKDFLAWMDRMRPEVVICQTESPAWWCREHRPAVAARTAFVVQQLDVSRVDSGFTGTVEDHARVATIAMKLLDTEVHAFERGTPEVSTQVLVDMAWCEGRTLPPLGARGDANPFLPSIAA